MHTWRLNSSLLSKSPLKQKCAAALLQQTPYAYMRRSTKINIHKVVPYCLHISRAGILHKVGLPKYLSKTPFNNLVDNIQRIKEVANKEKKVKVSYPFLLSKLIDDEDDVIKIKPFIPKFKSHNKDLMLCGRIIENRMCKKK